jgi:uncharacterized protein (TIGR03382 family)
MIAIGLAAVALAGVPQGPWPDCAEDNLGACPSDFGDWDMISWIPPGSLQTVRPAEIPLGSGIAADQAFQITGGRWDAIVAVLDSGIYWQEDDLAEKFFLNAGELPLPIDASGAESADPDGNGVLTIADYRDDPRVSAAAGVDVADGVLEPSDLIAVFSDGVDDDGNGYADDICGWDFFGGDNNAFADPQSTNTDHGTGVMEEAAAGASDGGDLGTCPNCAILPIRVGDTFVTDGDRVGLALAFAADHHAASAAMAIGALTLPGWAEQAAGAAVAAGVTLVGAAGDENAYHRNLPAGIDEILYVHSITADSTEETEGVYSYFNTWNCNNFGPRMELVSPSGACATGAVAKITGAAALVASAGRDAGLDLTPAEIRQLLNQTATDIDLTEAEREISNAWPSHAGWDAFHGYGRLHLGRAVAAVVAGEIPPTAQLDGPRWFTWAGDGRGVTLSGTVAAPRDAVASWTIEAGAGADPADWTVVASGDGPAEGALAVVDLPAATGDLVAPLFEGVVDRQTRAHQHLVQLRLTVTDTRGIRAEGRTAVWVHDEPAALPGFPVDLGTSVESSVVLADVDGAPGWEVIVSGSDGQVHALTGDGTDLPGFPVTTDPLPHAASATWSSGAIATPHEGLLAGPAVGDLDGDGTAEIVAASLGGRVYAWRRDGSRLPGFPVAITGRGPEEVGPGKMWDHGVAAAPALGDVDGDGALEIVVAGMDQRLYVWRSDGQLLPGYPVGLCAPDTCDQLGARVLSPPALGDIDGDGDLDAALGTNEIPVGAAALLYLVDLPAAALWPGYPQKRSGLLNEVVLPLIGEGHPAGVALADLDGDGDLELSSNAMLGSQPPIHADGTDALDMTFTLADFGVGTEFSEGSMIPAVNEPVFADLTGDGQPDFLSGGVGVQWLVSLAVREAWDYEHAVGAWDGATGAGIPGFPRRVEDLAFLSAPTVADLDGDGRRDVLGASGGGLVHAWSNTGQPLAGWPKLTGGWTLGGPSIGDIDGDGDLDVVVATRDGLIFAWGTDGDAGQAAEWPMTRHDAQNTANRSTRIPGQTGRPNPVAEEPGCGCASAPAPAGWALVGTLAWLVRRRRR